MELKEIIEQEKQKIAEVLKSIGYIMSDQISVTCYSDGDMPITITLRREK